MEILFAFIIAILVGLIVWFICTLAPFTKRYAEVVGLVAALITLVWQLGGWH